MGRRTGCLIIHGFGGSLAEIDPLSNYLSDKGFVTACPVLKGHMAKRRDLARAKCDEWIESAEEELIRLEAACDNVILIGFSMGGLIAFNLALGHDISAIVTLSTPIYYCDLRRVCLNIAGDFKEWNFNHVKHYLSSFVRIPVSALMNFEKLLNRTKGLLNRIDYPIFVAQGLMDDTVQYRSADYIYSNISSREKKIKYYKNANHIICHSCDRDEVFGDVEQFVSCFKH